MNNTMKNLKDEIERTYYRVISYDDPMVKENLESVTGILLSKEALTSLIEQEKERAVREFVAYIRAYGSNTLDTNTTVSFYRDPLGKDLDFFVEQYLAERKS